MANYDYECTKCKHEWEASRPIAERNNEVCPECGGEAQIVFWSGRSASVSLYYEHAYPVKITDLSPKPEDEHIVHSKREHKNVLARYQKECPAFM